MKDNLKERLAKTFIEYCKEHEEDCTKCDGPCYKNVSNTDTTIFEAFRSLLEDM